MHCGVDLREYKVEISPKIEVSPKIETKFTAPKQEREKCEICGERDAVVYCKQCGRKVCYGCFEPDYFKPSYIPPGRPAVYSPDKLNEFCILCGKEWIEERILNAKKHLIWLSSRIKEQEKIIEEYKKKYKNHPEIRDQLCDNAFMHLLELGRYQKNVEEFIEENIKNLNKIRERLAKISKRKVSK